MWNGQSIIPRVEAGQTPASAKTLCDSKAPANPHATIGSLMQETRTRAGTSYKIAKWRATGKSATAYDFALRLAGGRLPISRVVRLSSDSGPSRSAPGIDMICRKRTVGTEGHA